MIALWKLRKKSKEISWEEANTKFSNFVISYIFFHSYLFIVRRSWISDDVFKFSFEFLGSVGAEEYVMETCIFYELKRKGFVSVSNSVTEKGVYMWMLCIYLLWGKLLVLVNIVDQVFAYGILRFIWGFFRLVQFMVSFQQTLLPSFNINFDFSPTKNS